jgi:glycosyltransferase involved in cell wall biosynthesis
VANLRVEKRHDVFISAARALAARHRHMRFFIIGDGPQRDMVQSAAEASGLDHERLRLLGARHDVAALWPGLDSACLCSEVECFSVSMLEAAASGVAFVAPDVGCLGEFLVDGQTGLLTRPADPEGLTRALRKRLVELARRRVVHEYGIETMAAAFSDLYHEVVRRRVAGGGRSPRGVRPQNRRNERGLRSPADTGRPVVLGGSVGV